MLAIDVASWQDLTISIAFILGAILGAFAGVFVVLRVLRILTDERGPRMWRRRHNQDELDSEDST